VLIFGVKRATRRRAGRCAGLARLRGALLIVLLGLLLAGCGSVATLAVRASHVVSHVDRHNSLRKRVLATQRAVDRTASHLRAEAVKVVREQDRQSGSLRSRHRLSVKATKSLETRMRNLRTLPASAAVSRCAARLRVRFSHKTGRAPPSALVIDRLVKRCLTHPGGVN